MLVLSNMFLKMFAYLYIFCHVLIISIILPPYEKVADIFLDEYKAMDYLHEEVGIFNFNLGLCKKCHLGCMMPGIVLTPNFTSVVIIVHADYFIQFLKEHFCRDRKLQFTSSWKQVFFSGKLYLYQNQFKYWLLRSQI